MERLDKILSSTGRWSRKEARELIRAGRVTVEGKIQRQAEYKCERQGIAVDGGDLEAEKYLYLMMNKPAGLLSATEDPRQRTVVDLLPEHLRRVGLFPAGRLDKDSEGLLLLTNDGALAHALLSPRRHVEKLYLVRVEGRLDEADREAFAQGMRLEDGLHCLPAGLEILPGEGDEALVKLHEGKYHQIKRMLLARGKPVKYLKRLAMGPVALDGALPPGGWRGLRQEELDALRRAGAGE